MKILIIQQKRIGDVLTSSMLCNILKDRYPDAIIDFMCYANSTDVLKNNPNISEIIVLEEKTRKSYFLLFSFIRSIYKKKYDIIIDAYCKLETNLICLFSKAKKTISYKKGYSDFFYTNVVKRLPNGSPSKSGLAIDNRLKLLNPLLGRNIKIIKPKIFLASDEILFAKNTLIQFGIEKKVQPILMFNILGSEWYKSLPFSKMAEIIDFSIKQTNAFVLFNYIPSQKKLAQNIFELCNKNSQQNIFLNIYSKNLRGFLGLLSQTNALIGNEGGAINMAKALNIPTFSLFSPSVDKETWQIFEDDPKNVSIHLKDLKPEIYEKFDEKYIKDNTFKYYEEYPIEIILNKLDSFFSITRIKE